MKGCVSITAVVCLFITEVSAVSHSVWCTISECELLDVAIYINQ